jgi:NDP-sugar pyrophosphorylase family protein
MMIAVILAGGLGSRLRPITDVIPKPLLPIGDKALLEIQIEILKSHGFDKVFLCTYYKSEYIRNFFGDGSRYGVELSIVKEEIPLGTAGPIKLLSDKLTEPFILMNGDIITKLNLLDMYKYSQAQQSLLTIGTKEIVTKSQFGNIVFDGDFVAGIEEKPQVKTIILAGVCVIKPELLSLIPQNSYFGMDTLIQLMVARNMPITHFQIHDYWLDIGRIDDYNKAQEMYKEHFTS